MKQIENFLDKLSIDKSSAKLLTDYNKIIYSISNDFDNTLFLFETLLLCTKKNRTQFFNEHLYAFNNAKEVLLLSKNIEDTFSVDTKKALCLSINIANQNDICLNNYTQNIIEMITKNMDITVDETISYITKNPDFLSLDMKTYFQNLHHLNKHFKLEKQTFKAIFLSCPSIFCKKDLLNQVRVISKCVNLSAIKFNAFLRENYKVLIPPLTLIKKNVDHIIKTLRISDFEAVNLFRANPKVLLLPKNSIFTITRTIMKTFSISEKQVKNIFEKCPTLITLNPQSITKRYEELMSTKIFVKRDLKDIIISSPQILIMPLKTISNNILKLSSNLLLTNENQLAKFIRQCPNVLAYNNISKKIKSLVSFEIPRAYIQIAPKILSTTTLITGIKYALLKPFNLTYELDDIISLDIDLITARIKYLSINHKPINDVTLIPSLFESKYKISSNILLRDYSSTLENNLLLISISAKCLKNTKNYTQFISYFNPNFINTLKLSLTILQQNQEIIHNKNIVEISLILSSLGIDECDIKLLTQIIPSYTSAIDVLSIIEILISLNLTREQIIKIILSRPTILLSSPNLIEEYICDFNNSNKNIFEVLKNED